MPLRRLNRAEYDASIRALFGLTHDYAAAEFPPDPVQNGFDTNAEVQTVSTLHIERYEEVAWKIADEVVRRELDPGEELVLQAEGGLADGIEFYSLGNYIENGARRMWPWYEISTVQRFAETSTYTLSVRGWREPGNTGALLETLLQIRVDDIPVLTHSVTSTRGAPEIVSLSLPMVRGVHRVTVLFLEDPVMESSPRLALDYLRIARPQVRIAAGERRVWVCELREPGCVERTVARLQTRAYRRTPTPDESIALVRLLERESARGPEAQITAAIAATLVAPAFLYRPESDGAEEVPLEGVELLTRLSYLLWSGPPDEAQIAAAEDGALDSEGGRAQMVRDMLADPRAEALVRDFAGQWLATRAYESVSLSSSLYPAFDGELKRAFRDETESMFRELLGGQTSALALIDADFAYLGDRLADHYGLPRPGSATPVRVTLADRRRGGILGQGGWLSLMSTPTRPSPVLRGRWVLENLLCAPPGEPPANFGEPPPLPDPDATFRQRLAAHRSNPACAGCHIEMDALGFGLDHFAADGRWRMIDHEGHAVDAAGALPGGRAFQTVEALREILRDDPRVRRCMVEKVLTYGIGRTLGCADEPAVAAITAAWRARGERLPDLFELVASSRPFMRRAPEAP